MSTPHAAQRRRGEAAGWGSRPTPTAKIRRWQPFKNAAGTMRGFVSAELPSSMIINDLKLMIGPNGKHWIALPSVKQVEKDGTPRLDANGKPIYAQVVEFANRVAADKFRDLILDALRRQHPGALDESLPTAEQHPESDSPGSRSAYRRPRPAAAPGPGTPMHDDPVCDLWAGP